MSFSVGSSFLLFREEKEKIFECCNDAMPQHVRRTQTFKHENISSYYPYRSLLLFVQE